MDKKLHPTLYNGCNYLFMLERVKGVPQIVCIGEIVLNGFYCSFSIHGCIFVTVFDKAFIDSILFFHMYAYILGIFNKYIYAYI